MLEIKDLYKVQNQTKLNIVDLSVISGGITSIECSIESSNLLVSLILGKELPARGEIFIDNIRNIDFMNKKLNNTGVIFYTEGLYERMTVGSYLLFFSELLSSSTHYEDVMMKLGLLDIVDHKIAGLSFSQKRRLSFARERLKDVKLLFFQEPLANIDKDSARMITENIEEMRQMGTAVLCTSASYKEALLLGGSVYLLDENGLAQVNAKYERIATVLPNHNLRIMLENIMQGKENPNLTFSPYIIIVWVVMASAAFMYTYKKKSLDK